MFEEIEKIVKNFLDESEQVKKQISEIENKRTELAQERNEKKRTNINRYMVEINVLGNQISKLGNQSQELQNRLNNKFNEVKNLVNLTIDNLISEGIRKIRKIDEERQELEDKISLQKEREIKYEMQKQEFYNRFGRMPELSENAKKEDEIQDKQCQRYRSRLEEVKEIINNYEIEIAELIHIKKETQRGNWSNIIIEENTEIKYEEIEIPEFIVEELEPIENITVKEFEQIEEFNIQEIEIEDFGPIEELNVEEFKENEEYDIEQLFKELFKEENNQEEIENTQTIEENAEEKEIDKIEELAKAIVEKIVEEQTKDFEFGNVEKQEIDAEQEIISFEETEERKGEKITESKPSLISIIGKIEDGNIVYKAQISNGEEIKIYPTKLNSGNALLNYNQKRKEIREMLAEYIFLENKIFDKKVSNKIDTIICEILNEFAKKYNYDVRELIYNYAMSFSKYIDISEEIVPITYNFSYLNTTNLRNTEKRTIAKICKNANSNIQIDVIGNISNFSKIKYILKRLFMTNSIEKLPEGKY